MNCPLLSILIPTLNANAAISKVFDSVLAQTFSDFEIWVIDGKSNDCTENIVRQYSILDDRIHWHSERDNGIYDAMNKGIKLSKGEWLLFLGSDDYLFDVDVLSEAAKSIREEEKVQILYGNVQLSRPIGYHFDGLVYAGRFDEDELLKKNICHQAIFYHRSVFERYGMFRTRYKVFADYDFNLRCFNEVQPKYIDKIIAHFSLEGQSNSRQDADTIFREDFLENMAVYYPYSFKHSFFNGRKKELFALLLKNICTFKTTQIYRIVRILVYQSLKIKKPGRININANPTHQTP